MLTVFGTGNATQVNTIVAAIDTALLEYNVVGNGALSTLNLVVGIVVAMLGSLHPVGIVIAALFMALISAGSVPMQVKTGIPVSFTSVLEALIVLFILLGMAVSAAQSKRKKVG